MITRGALKADADAASPECHASATRAAAVTIRPTRHPASPSQRDAPNVPDLSRNKRHAAGSGDLAAGPYAKTSEAQLSGGGEAWHWTPYVGCHPQEGWMGFASVAPVTAGKWLRLILKRSGRGGLRLRGSLKT
jgi:hypothetical protein